jgi:signal-transduction protein with cAMP-binding, CBS, and nucleotidyltransferase domain
MITGTLCRRKLATIWPGDTLRTAARHMEDDEVGTLIVVEPGSTQHAVGMLTDRDLAIRCVARGLDPDTTSVSQVMSSPVHTINEHAPLEFALSEMASAATRRLVVTGKSNEAVGIISLDDLLGLMCEQAATLGMLLQKQRPLIAV